MKHSDEGIEPRTENQGIGEMTRAFFCRIIQAALLTVCVAGCWGSSIPKPAEPDEARNLLISALDAWKGGSTLKSLQERKPPVYVADDDWAAGNRLLDFKLDPDDRLVGVSLRCTVVLSLQTPQRERLERTAHYTVATNPVGSVVRDDADFD